MNECGIKIGNIKKNVSEKKVFSVNYSLFVCISIYNCCDHTSRYIILYNISMSAIVVRTRIIVNMYHMIGFLLYEQELRLFGDSCRTEQTRLIREPWFFFFMEFTEKRERETVCVCVGVGMITWICINIWINVSCSSLQARVWVLYSKMKCNWSVILWPATVKSRKKWQTYCKQPNLVMLNVIYQDL